MTASNSDSPLLFPFADGPDFSNEARQMKRGIEFVCGVDEAGRGPLAGPVTSAAIILRSGTIPEGLDDSKKLNQARREQLFECLLKQAIVSVAHVSAPVIDLINIREASLLSMKRAVEGLAIAPGHALIDGNAIPENLPCPASALIRGDGRSLSIAAASIIAKVMRDRLMKRADGIYPGYGLATHKGYPTAAHRKAINRLGPCTLHRRSFAPLRDACYKP